MIRSSMKVFFPILLFVLGSCSVSFSQGTSRYRAEHNFDIAASVSPGSFSGALSWSHLHPVALKGKLKLGYGVRLTSFIGANKFYTTAPAKYTSPVQNLGTIFSRTIEENIDTITTATASTNSANIALYIECKLSPRFDIGFNIDAVGFSFGPEKQFNIISSTFDPNQAPVQSGSPTTLNLLLTSDNDIGSLNSEFYLKYNLNERIGIRGGFTFLFSEYRTNNDLSFNNNAIVNDRYRYKAGMIMLAVSLRPFNKGL